MISRRTTFIIVIIVISLVVGGLIGFYFYTKNKNPGSTILGGNTPRTNFGGYNLNITGSGSTGSNNPIISSSGSAPEIPVPKLRHISLTPTAGSDFITLPIYEEVPKNIEPADASASSSVKKAAVPAKAPKIIGYKSVIRFMERGTGHIYETSTSTLINDRISNYTEPKIYEAYFVGNGDNIILRNLVGNSDVINSRYATLVYATTSSGAIRTLSIKDLPVQIANIAISPSKNQLFSIMKDGARGILSKIDGGSAVGIFDTPYKEWLASWPEEKNILLTTKASGFAPGFAYFLNTQTKEMTRVLGNIYGLTTLPSPDATKILYNESANGDFTLNLLDRSEKVQYQIPFKTLSEKCIWAKTEKNVIYCAVPENIAFGTYPDTWYQGQINFADSIWKYNLSTGESRQISNIQTEFGQVIDATNLSISPNDDYLVFTNKIDLSLWGIQLVEPVKKVIVNPLDAIGTSTATSSNR